MTLGKKRGVTVTFRLPSTKKNEVEITITAKKSTNLDLSLISNKVTMNVYIEPVFMNFHQDDITHVKDQCNTRI